MGYALFAQRKVCLTSQLNMVQLQQTQRSNEQYLLSTRTLSLQQQLSSVQSSQSLQLAELYELMAGVESDGFSDAIMEKYKGKNKDGSEFSKTAKDIIDAEQADKYEGDANESKSVKLRNAINDKIKQLEKEQQAEIDKINRDIYLVSVKENAIEMQVKSLDTQVSAIQKQLEAVEEAEGSAIDRATPKFKGVG